MNEVKWIKIDTQIFDNRKIRQIEKMPEGDAIIVIWFKLLCLSGCINDGGLIYFTKELPYTDEMLSTEFGRPLQIVRLALTTFQKFGMIELIDDVLYISSWEKYQNIEGLEKIREQTRKRVARHRESKILELPEHCSVTCNVTETQSNATDIDKEIEIDKEKEKEVEKIKKKTLVPAPQYFESENLNSIFLDFIKMRKSIKAQNTDRAIKSCINRLKKLAEIPFSEDFDEQRAIDILDQSIRNSWKDVYALKEDKQQSKNQSIADRWRDI